MNKNNTTRQLWSDAERSLIASTITDGIKLSDITDLIPNRTEAAIIREVYKTNCYSIRTVNDGIKRFFTEIKTRNRGRKEKSTETLVWRPVVSVEKNVEENQQTIIVPQKVKNSTKELKSMALVLLFENGLLATAESVKQTIKLIKQFQKEVSL